MKLQYLGVTKDKKYKAKTFDGLDKILEKEKGHLNHRSEGERKEVDIM